MKVREIRLSNFRNYENLELSFGSSINIFVGENAQGKTNLIESIYMCAFAKSFRRNNSTEIVMYDRGSCNVTIKAEIDEIEKKISITVDRDGNKMVTVDNKAIKRVSDLLNNLVVVAFTPDDLSIIKAGPDIRRSFIDREMCQIKPSYQEYLRYYNEALRQKNSILKGIYNSDEGFHMMDVFDEQLSKYGVEIIKLRRIFADRLNEKAGEIYNNIAGGNEKLRIVYRASHEEEGFYEALLGNREKDIYRGYSGIGPHRDDIEFYIDGKDARKFGSQGQQRTIALSLKLAEIRIAREEMDESPVLLLDDVLSELDADRQNYLFNEIEYTQVFITTTEIDSQILKRLPNSSLYRVNKGHVESIN